MICPKIGKLPTDFQSGGSKNKVRLCGLSLFSLVFVTAISFSIGIFAKINYQEENFNQ